ncbi:MAG: TraR/DksA family transcriptional regulator [Pseudomonadota bacterium]
MDAKIRMKFRERLDQEHAALDAADAATKEDRAPVELDQTSVGRLSRMDAIQQQAMASAQARRRAGRRRAIAAALRRMDDDEFGWCQLCGEEIPFARLDLDPCAANCVGCSN